MPKFTGFKDKNNTKIYEGDTLIYKDKKIKVKYSFGAFRCCDLRLDNWPKNEIEKYAKK